MNLFRSQLQKVHDAAFPQPMPFDLGYSNPLWKPEQPKTPEPKPSDEAELPADLPPVIAAPEPEISPEVREHPPIGERLKRQNLTMRMEDSHATRLTNAFLKKWEGLRAGVALCFAEYTFLPQSSDIECRCSRWERGVTDHVKEIETTSACVNFFCSAHCICLYNLALVVNLNAR